MPQSLRMCVCERKPDSPKNAQLVRKRNSRPDSGCWFSVNIAHAVVKRCSTEKANVIDWNDMRMLESCGNHRFSDELLDVRAAFEQFLPHGLQGNDST